MDMLKRVALAAPVAVVLLAPGLGSGAEKIIPPLVGMVKEGKATISANKKTLIDEKGNIVAKETDVLPKLEAVMPGQKTGPQKTLTICNYKCAIVTRRCFADDSGSTTVCINTCDKESLVCEDVTPQ